MHALLSVVLCATVFGAPRPLPGVAPPAAVAVAVVPPVSAPSPGPVLPAPPPPPVLPDVASYRWPVAGRPWVVRGFDPPPVPWGPGHRGVDLAETLGTPIYSAGAGTVHVAGRIVERGVVSVGHPNGLRTTYEPLEPLVSVGQQVRPGTPIGILAGGHPGCPAPACLHWGLRRGDAYLDPLILVGVGRFRLLPVQIGTPAGPTSPAWTRRAGRAAGRRAAHTPRAERAKRPAVGCPGSPRRSGAWVGLAVGGPQASH